MKLAVVGGGSTYTPELVDGFARLRDTLPLTELALIDPAAERVELIGGLARRIFARQGHPGRVSTHTELESGVEGATAVLIQLRVGGQATRNVDETFPLEFCCVGQETTGAGGDLLKDLINRELHTVAVPRPTLAVSTVEGNPVLAGALQASLRTVREDLFSRGVR